MGDRLAVMREGMIEQVGTFDELYYTPANVFVATFIGTPPINLLPAEIGAGHVSVGSQSWVLPETLAAALKPGQVRVGVRPENWLLDTSDGAPLQISHIERIPTERAAFLHGILAGTSVVAVTSLEQPEVKSVLAVPDWERVLFFAAEDERVIYTPGVPE